METKKIFNILRDKIVFNPLSLSRYQDIAKIRYGDSELYNEIEKFINNHPGTQEKVLEKRPPYLIQELTTLVKYEIETCLEEAQTEEARSCFAEMQKYLNKRSFSSYWYFELKGALDKYIQHLIGTSPEKINLKELRSALTVLLLFSIEDKIEEPDGLETLLTVLEFENLKI